MPNMLTETLSVNDVEAALKKALPGFEGRISVEEHTRTVVIEAKGPVWFFGKTIVDPYKFPLLTNDANEAFAESLRELVRGTRAHAIEQLGLDAEVKQQIEEGTRAVIAEAKAHWEQEGWRKGYADAAKDLSATFRDVTTASVETEEQEA